MAQVGELEAKGVWTEELVEFVRSFALRVGQPNERRPHESVVGEPPDALYVFDTTDPAGKPERLCIGVTDAPERPGRLDRSLHAQGRALGKSADRTSELAWPIKGVFGFVIDGMRVLGPPPQPLWYSAGGPGRALTVLGSQRPGNLRRQLSDGAPCQQVDQPKSVTIIRASTIWMRPFCAARGSITHD